MITDNPPTPTIVERLRAEKYESDEHGIFAKPRNPDGRKAADLIDELTGALAEARAALHQHYVDWDGEPEDAVPLQLARAKCDAALAKVQTP